jgi:hypothetical protein
MFHKVMSWWLQGATPLLVVTRQASTRVLFPLLHATFEDLCSTTSSSQTRQHSLGKSQFLAFPIVIADCYSSWRPTTRPVALSSLGTYPMVSELLHRAGALLIGHHRRHRRTHHRDSWSCWTGQQLPPRLRQGNRATKGLWIRRVRRRRRRSLRRAQPQRPRNHGQEATCRLVQRQWRW